MNFLARLADGIFGSRLPAVFEERIHRKAFVHPHAEAEAPGASTVSPDTAEPPVLRAIAGYVA